jgi:NitT/TauT family transport system ATP-binding protein
MSDVATASADRARASQDSAFIVLDNVSIAYGGENGVLVLTETSLTIRRGEFVAIVGPSGCGKSSALKLVSGLHPALRGEVTADGG